MADIVEEETAVVGKSAWVTSTPHTRSEARVSGPNVMMDPKVIG